MTFNDIFKSSFLDNITAVSVLDMVLVLLLSFCLGLFIFFVYKKTYQGVMYSSSFGVTLISLTMISAFVILTVTSNVVLSLGMVGALSIVRFRTAIKDPLDISFLFWSIAVGIVLAAGMIPLAVFGSVFIGIVMIVFVNKKSSSMPYLMIVSFNDAKSESEIMDIIKVYTEKSIIKNKTVTKNNVELNIEVRLRNDETEFVNRLSELDYVNHAVLVSYTGEYMN